MSTLVAFEALQASAGSGKTFALVVRYLSLLFMEERPEEILALTFTNKAANEMQTRIITTLDALESRPELEPIAALCGLSTEAVLSRRDRVLYRVLSAETKVMTLDSFFARILRKFALHAGIMPTFGTFEAQHGRKVRNRFLHICEIEGTQEALVALSQIGAKRLNDIFVLLDDLYARMPELSALRYEDKPVETVANTLLVAHERLVQCVAVPSLSNRALKSLQAQNIEDLSGKGWIARESLNYWDFKKAFKPEWDELLQEVQSALVDYMQAKEQRYFSHLLMLLELYKSAKLAVAKEENELGFDDVTAMTYALLRERSVDSEFLYFRLNSRISHILLDEFQDTSIVQFEILRPLIEEMRSGSGIREQDTFFMVGDVKQSIYRFRGGTKALFDAAIDQFALQTDALRTNYRSAQSVVNFVNHVFDNQIDGYSPQYVKADAPQGYVEVLQEDDPLEAAYGIVQSLLKEGAAINDIAILTSTNTDGEAIRAYLSERDIDVKTETTLRLIHQPRVASLIEYFKYCYFGEEIYAHNFFALADLPYLKELPRRRVERGALVDTAIEVIRECTLYDGDVNVIRFLQELQRFDEIEQLLFEYERIDTVAAGTTVQGVRVLTVHKSKGLEYPYVIVLDRLGRERADNAPILFDYDGVRLEQLYLRQKARDALDPDYAQALAREKALQHDDAMNALYVAFTRARDHLYVIQKPKASKFEMLELEVRQYGEKTVTAAQNATSDHPAVEYQPTSYGRQKNVQKETTEQSHDPYAVLLGTALHYALEMMPGFDASSLKQAMIPVRNRFGNIIDETTLGQIERRIERLIGHEPFLALCRDAEHFHEQAISYAGELRYIDLLLRRSDGYIVIDYKSSRSHHDDHLAQISFYKKAVAKITAEPVQGILCYVLESGVELEVM